MVGLVFTTVGPVNKLRALFLDIDGVANSEASMRRQYRLNGNKPSMLAIDPEMAFMVGKIILQTQCVLVISSSWRNWPDGLSEIKEKIYPDIYGVTPNLRSGFRGEEIESYIKDHPEITHYAILDDESDFYEYQPLFKTSWKKGITNEIAQNITEYLLNGK